MFSIIITSSGLLMAALLFTSDSNYLISLSSVNEDEGVRTDNILISRDDGMTPRCQWSPLTSDVVTRGIAGYRYNKLDLH